MYLFDVLPRHAHLRGTRVTCDLSRDWDYEAEFATPLEEVRRRFNVLPLAR